MFRYVDVTDQGVHHMPAADLVRTDWSLPGTDKIGFMRTICRGYRSAGASLGVGVMPIGQRSPLHTTHAEHLLLGLAGELTWRVEGTDIVMREMDLLYIGAGHEYEYWNSAFSEARFVDVIAKVEGWPPVTDYVV